MFNFQSFNFIRFHSYASRRKWQMDNLTPVAKLPGFTNYVSPDGIIIKATVCLCSNWPTFPQIFINGEFVGGSDIILSMHQASERIITISFSMCIQLVSFTWWLTCSLNFLQKGELKGLLGGTAQKGKQDSAEWNKLQYASICMEMDASSLSTLLLDALPVVFCFDAGLSSSCFQPWWKSLSSKSIQVLVSWQINATFSILVFWYVVIVRCFCLDSTLGSVWVAVIND